MWAFSISQGVFLKDGEFFFANAYSGAPGYKNDPSKEAVVGKGPLPEGWYTIQPAIYSDTLGPVAMELVPDESNDMKGRGDFWIHADSIHHPGEASHGCIVMEPRAARERLEDEVLAGDNRLQVIA